MVGEKVNSVLDSAEKEETIYGRVKDDSPENAQQPAFPEKNVSEPLEENTLEEEKVEDYVAEYAGTVLRLKEEPMGEEHEDDLVINLASNEYFKAVSASGIHTNINTPVFKDFKNGKYKIGRKIY